MNEKARSLLEAFGRATAAEPAPARLEAIWSGVADARPARRWWPVLAVVAAAAVVVVGVGRGGSSSSPGPVEGRAVVRPGVALKPGATVRGQFSFLVTQAAAWVEETEAGTVLFVESGEVQWRTRTRSGVARAGERIVLKEEVAPPALTVEATLYEAAMAAPPGERARLLRAVRAKFPDGAFAPEVAIGLMQVLDKKEAADEARGFLAKFPSDPRAASVKQWLGSRR